MFRNRVLRKIFGSKKHEVTGEWRRLLIEELYDLYSSPNIIWMIKSRRMRWTGYVVCIEDRKDSYRVVVGRPDGKRQLGRPGHRWEDIMKMDIQEVGWEGMDWIDLAEDRDM